jgi:hypothetical protein
MTSINNICTLILDEDVQGTITFKDKEMRDYFVRLKDELDDAAYKNDILEGARPFRQELQR